MYWPSSSLLRVGGDLNSELDTLLQCVTCALVHRLHWLNVHAADHQSILVEAQTRSHCQLLVKAENSWANDSVRVLQAKTTSAGELVNPMHIPLMCVTLWLTHEKTDRLSWHYKHRCCMMIGSWINQNHRFTLWKSSNCTEATAPLILEAMALHASPTKSGTEKRAAACVGSDWFFISKCLIMKREKMWCELI